MLSEDDQMVILFLCLLRYKHRSYKIKCLLRHTEQQAFYIMCYVSGLMRYLMDYLSIVASRSGPTEMILIGTPMYCSINAI